MATTYYQIADKLQGGSKPYSDTYGLGFADETGKWNILSLSGLAADLTKQGDPYFTSMGLSPNLKPSGGGSVGQVLLNGGQTTITEASLAKMGADYLKDKYGFDIGSLAVQTQYNQPGSSIGPNMVGLDAFSSLFPNAPTVGKETPQNTGQTPEQIAAGQGTPPPNTLTLTTPTTPASPVQTATTGQTSDQPAPIPFKAGLDNTQKLGIQNLVLSGKAFNETDAKNYAYATGNSNWQQFVGKTGLQIVGTGYGGKSPEQLAKEQADREAGYGQNASNLPPAGGAAAGGGTSGVATPETKGEPPSAGATATDVLDYLGVSNSLTESDVTNQALMSPEFQLLLDRINARDTSSVAAAEVLKQALETKFAGDKSNLEQKLSEVGLTFSVIRATQVKALADDLAASELAVDRKLASQLMDSNFDLKEAIMNIASDIIKDASKGREEAIAQLNKAGLAVVGNQLIPTLESQRQTLSAEMDAAKFELEQAKFVLSKAKTTADIEEANRRIDLAEREYQLSVSREQRLGGGGTSGTITGGLSEIDVLAKSYLAGESLGNIGLKRGAVLLRAEEIQREELLNQMSDPEFLAMQIDEAQAKGEVFQDTLQDLRALGVPEESIRAAVKFRIDKTNYEQQNTGFFRRLFSF